MGFWGLAPKKVPRRRGEKRPSLTVFYTLGCIDSHVNFIIAKIIKTRGCFSFFTVSFGLLTLQRIKHVGFLTT